MGLVGSKPSSEPAAKEETAHGDQQVNNVDASGLAVAQENGGSQQKPRAPGPNGLQKRRMSFYETVDASEVLPYLIIGNLASSKNQEFLSRKNVRYILNLTNETEVEAVEGIDIKHIQMEDDDDQDLLAHLTPCFQFINKASSPQKKEKAEIDKATVLVHSYFGMSRSSAVIIAYLMKEKNWSLREAYQHIKGKHSSVNPNDNFVVQLIRFEQELFGKMSMTVKDFH